MYEKTGIRFWMPVFASAVVLVLIVLVIILILAVVLVTVLIVVLILVLVIHDKSSEYLYLRHCRPHSVTGISAFILWLKNQAYQQACGDGCSDAAGAGLQSAGENTEETVFLYGFLHTFGRLYPKPVKGTVAPAPANSASGS